MFRGQILSLKTKRFSSLCTEQSAKHFRLFIWSVFKNYFCQVRVTVCGRFGPNEKSIVDILTKSEPNMPQSETCR